MKKFTNPLDNIKIASPCSANWNEMYGDQRKRHCSQCKLNVYDLSEMTRDEAESFLINAEGRVCLRVFRRTDGTVITQDCPVGWARIKRKVSRTATAVFALMVGFFGGVFALESLRSLREFTNYDKVPEPFIESKDDKISFGIYGALSNLPKIKEDIFRSREF